MSAHYSWGSPKTELAKLSLTELKPILIESATRALNIHREEFLTKRGVTCFSECNDDLLMWSHYGGRYKGFCLEFCSEEEPFNKLRKVQYVTKMPSLCIDSLFVDEHTDQFFNLFCTKSNVWAYEKEWRGYHEKAGTEFKYNTQSLKAVYFGPDIEFQALEIVCLILIGQNPDINYFRGYRSDSEFKVIFKQFSYTTSIEAKRKGLL